LGTLVTPTQQKSKADLKLHLMIMTEEFKKDINNSFKEIQENTGKQVEGLKKETQKSLKELQENNQTGKGTEQNHLGSKIGSRNNKENTKGDNSGDRNPRKEIRNHRIHSPTEYKR
jgi:ribosome recycling factor